MNSAFATAFLACVRSRVCGLGLACMVALLFAGCAAGPAKPVPFTLTLQSAPDLNPDASGRPSPVVVRVYQLAADAEFLRADFFALYNSDEATLGKTLLGKQEVIALPGATTPVRIELSREARMLGFLVAYRDIDHARWRLTSAPSGALTLSLDAREAQFKTRKQK